MDLTTTKIVVALLFGLIRFFFGILPIKLYTFLRKWEGEDDTNTFINQKRHDQVNCLIALCQSFGGGVLFATCFLHMMLDVYKSVEELKKYGNVTTDYPVSQLIISCGFFFVYFLEEISHWLISVVPNEPCKGQRVPKSARKWSQRTISPITNKVSPIEDNDSAIESPAYTIEENLKQLEAEGFEAKSISEDAFSISSEVMRENKKNLSLDNDKPSEEEEDSIKEEKTQQQYMRFILVVLALSFHAVFEGLAIGIQQNTADIWYLFIAVSIHSVTILFCIALEMLLAKCSYKTIFVQTLLLSLASPFGVITGLLITLTSDMNSKVKSTAVVLLEGLSAGTIIYITFFEVLNREKVRRVYRLRRAFCILAGFTLMAVLQYLEVAS